MSDIIRVLPDSVANQIAAGEVIQRPASVIKELVENAVDAHATKIQIFLKDAGRTLIQIIDNGIGMSDTDARLAFERHSTSKIRQAEDLFTLTTMGFRGEALASIAAISQVELRTRIANAQLGTRLVINASVCESQEPVACPQGSNFMVKNLFFNIPARRKFLKNNQVELSNIVKEFEKLALINNNVEFELVHNGTTIYKLQPGTFIQRISALFGKALDKQLIPVSVENSLISITGYVGRPENARKRNPYQFLFANERFMRHPYFHKAIISCYDQLIAADVQPHYFLRLNVEPQTIDVNIHPTKTEIKFENEQPIWQILSAAVRESIGRFADLPSIDFESQGVPVPPYDPNRQVEQPTLGTDTDYNPFKQGDRPVRQHTPMPDWEELYRGFEKQKSVTPQQQQLPSLVEGDDGQTSLSDSTTSFIQVRQRYIVSPGRSGMVVIDQHRAHLLVLYTRYVKQLAGAAVSSQALLFPDVIKISPSQQPLLEQLQPELEKMGFTISYLGGDDWSVSSVPSGIEGVNVHDLLLQVIESVEQGGASIESRVAEHVALRVASAAAIPYGRTLTQEEMSHLAADLLALPNPNYTPDGKPVIGLIEMADINRLF